MEKKIFYHDTDAGGVVYYANYLKYMEEARTEFFAQRSIDIKELAKSGTMFVVARQEVDYKFPGFYGDILKVSTKIASISTVKIDFIHEVKNQFDKIVCLGRTIMVCVDKDIRPKAIEGSLKDRLLEGGI